jgi:trans-2-enoyl-CoA reductase
MLDYIKTILTKVSFDIKLFEKELKKAIIQLINDDLEELKSWCYSKFSGKHQMVLDRCFISN